MIVMMIEIRIVMMMMMTMMMMTTTMMIIVACVDGFWLMRS